MLRKPLFQLLFGANVLLVQHYQVAALDAVWFRHFPVIIFLYRFPCILLRLYRLFMYVLHPVSIHCCSGVMSFSFFHPLCLWVKAVVGEEWGHFRCVDCQVIIGMFGERQQLVPVLLIVPDKCAYITF